MVVMRVDLFAASPQASIGCVFVAETVGAEDGRIDPWRAAADDVGRETPSAWRTINAAHAAGRKYDESAEAFGLGNDQAAIR